MSLKNAALGGLVATLVVTGLLLIEDHLGILPGLAWLAWLHRLTGGPMLLAWLAHAAIGLIAWPALFMSVEAYLPGRRRPSRGLWFGGYAWAAVMLLFLPVVGLGFFGLVLGPSVALSLLVLHLIYAGLLDALY